MPITPFRFRLKKVSGRDQRLLEAIYSYLPSTGLRDEFGRGIREALARHLGEEFSFRLEALQQESFSLYLSKLPQIAVMAVVGMAPLSRQAILEIDVPLAMAIIERLLGGQPEDMPEPRMPSDTEQGVLEYVLLHIAAHIHRSCGKDARVHFRLGRLAFHSHEVRELAAQDDGVAVLVFRVAIGRHSGFVRLALPDPFVEESLMEVEAPDEIRSAERAWRFAQWERLAFLKTSLWAEAGRQTLTPGDLAGLEEGDVILFDSGGAVSTGGGVHGKVVLRVGHGMQGGLDADLVTDGTRARCTISGFHKGV